MNMLYTFLTAILIGALVTLYWHVKDIHWTDRRQANEQTAIQFAIYTFSYLLMVSVKATGCCNFSVNIFLILMAGLSLRTNIGLSRQSVIGNQIPVTKENAGALLKIVAFLWYGLFSTMCCLNFAMTSLFPGLYSGLDDVGILDGAVNVVYYTFSVMLSYSGNGITPISSLSRLIEIAEVLWSYIFVGIVITNMIGKTAEA